MDFKSILSVTLILFSVIDILGSIPVLLDIKQKGTVIEPFKASAIAAVIMVLFLFFGKNILGLFGVDIPSFAVAGALIIFFLGIEMVLGITLFRDNGDNSTGSIVPIAFPLIAGAGTMTTIISLRVEYDVISILIGIILNIIFVYFILRSSSWIGKKLGKNGINVLRKVFGIILLAIAVKLFKEHLFGNIEF